MISSVATRNVGTGGNEDVLLIIKGVQTGNPNESEKRGSKKSIGEDDSQALTLNEIPTPPRPVNNAKPSYI